MEIKQFNDKKVNLKDSNLTLSIPLIFKTKNSITASFLRELERITKKIKTLNFQLSKILQIPTRIFYRLLHGNHESRSRHLIDYLSFAVFSIKSKKVNYKVMIFYKFYMGDETC